MNTKTTTSSNDTPVLPRQAVANAIDFGFGYGFSAAWRLLESYADPDGCHPHKLRTAAKTALAILEHHEVEVNTGFDPEKYISDSSDEY